MTKQPEENTFSNTAHHSEIFHSILRLRKSLQQLPQLDGHGLLPYKTLEAMRAIDQLLSTLELQVKELYDEWGEV